ncbi:hypothetical protein PPERSA_01914 [Pseudocohnilembus persalinus]|uniref:ubiquitinyl hydrolase 1 n=1 Tax=Pseudocohnilembus persalinus TaxID=266149 RepID=A0A0V0R3F5_PSEPJ|nr:hypothetical protein PPERSA_01914 [Pseudocohnilembus persalinus]|eukprot:KRX09027.1 hypothetical protein PPERSA_01914 [Pseudocohnilembus persalinus]
MDDQFNLQTFNQNRLKQIIKNQQVVSNPQYQKSKYAPKNEEAITWDPKQFKQYQEMYNQAINILEKEESKKKLHITLYNDPHPQNEKIGEIETFRDFANKDCTSSDEKLEIAKSYTLIGSRKPIRGDGNCFYRAVISQLLEKIFISSYANRALKLLGQIIDEKEFQIIEVISDYINENYLNQLTDLVRLNLISKIVFFIQQRCDLEKKVEKKKIIANIISQAFNQDNCNFDFSAVVLGRSYGALALQLYGQSKEYRDFCHDQEQLLQILYIYGQDVESTIIPIITETLDISLKIHNFEKVKNKWDIYGQEYKPKCYTVNLNEKQNQEPFMHHYIDVLLHQGHYQSIFTPNYTKNVYGTLKDKVKDFDRVEHERLQREKLLRSQFKIKVEFDTCLLCNNQKLTANTKQCDHRYCAQCLQKMVTFLEEKGKN